MKIGIMRNTAIIMLGLAMAFFWFALGHPEFSWPWNNTVTYGFYGIYLVVMTALFAVPVHKRRK
ncbi:MAG: hypothetical protein VB078_11035 [Clostridiaceae bacterium]|nr:hypothetical protein [Clostridiaceae bacterium]